MTAHPARRPLPAAVRGGVLALGLVLLSACGQAAALQTAPASQPSPPPAQQTPETAVGSASEGVLGPQSVRVSPGAASASGWTWPVVTPVDTVFALRTSDGRERACSHTETARLATAPQGLPVGSVVQGLVTCRWSAAQAPEGTLLVTFEREDFDYSVEVPVPRR